MHEVGCGAWGQCRMAHRRTRGGTAGYDMGVLGSAAMLHGARAHTWGRCRACGGVVGSRAMVHGPSAQMWGRCRVRRVCLALGRRRVGHRRTRGGVARHDGGCWAWGDAAWGTGAHVGSRPWMRGCAVLGSNAVWRTSAHVAALLGTTGGVGVGGDAAWRMGAHVGALPCMRGCGGLRGDVAWPPGAILGALPRKEGVLGCGAMPRGAPAHTLGRCCA
jgi:hypothetical protein